MASSRSLSRLSSHRAVAINRLTRSFSQATKIDDEDREFKHPQEFVKKQFEPGEWDPEYTDPLFKPPFKSRAKIMSAEDYATRPLVGFEEEFDSLKDAMVTLTWMDADDTDKVYATYLEVMAKSAGKKTSHEYVMRLLASQFNITAQRAAAIVELAHREDQHRKNGRKIYYDAQAYVDAKAKEHIRVAYSEFGEPEPGQFVEDPMGVTGRGDPETATGAMTAVGDLVDVDGLLADTVIRERKDARLKIDGHIYKEDVDDNTFDVDISKETQHLMDTAKSFSKMEESDRRGDLKPEPASHPRRDRWKYVAHTINTRENKKNKNKFKRKKEILDDILVEQGGEVRVATVAEVKSTCWKPKRHFQEFTYSSVKDAWLERTLRGETGGWGRQKAPEKPVETIAASTEEGDDAENDASAEEDAGEDSNASAETASEEASSEETSDSDDKKE